jgi:hypothetical protein
MPCLPLNPQETSQTPSCCGATFGLSPWLASAFAPWGPSPSLNGELIKSERSAVNGIAFQREHTDCLAGLFGNLELDWAAI